MAEQETAYERSGLPSFMMANSRRCCAPAGPARPPVPAQRVGVRVAR
jgi:hypothetical protein